MKSVMQLKELRKQAYADMQSWRKDKIGQEQSADYRSQWDKHLEAIDLLTRQIEDQEKIDSIERSLNHVEERRTETVASTGIDVKREFQKLIEKRDFSVRTTLQENNPASGQAFVANTLMTDVLEVAKPLLALYNSVDVVSGLGFASFPTITANMSDASDVSYGTDVSENTLATGKVSFQTDPILTHISVSNIELKSGLIYDAVVRHLGISLSSAIESKIATGTSGSEGMSIVGTIPSTRDVSTNNTTTELKWANIKTGFYTLDPYYQMSATIAMHQTFFAQLMTAVDGNGNTLAEAIELRDKGTFHGRPVVQSNKLNGTATTGLYAAISFGKYAYKWMEAGEFELFRDDYTKWKQDLVCLGMKTYGQGKPIFGEGFIRHKLA